MKIVVMGAGGLGGYLGAVLAKGGQDVTFIARGTSLDVMRQDGLRILSPRGDFVVDPVQVTSNLDPLGTADLILFCVKSYDANQALEMIKPMVGEKTVVIPVLNGIGHMATMRAQLGEEHVLGALVMLNAHKTAPGVVQHVADVGRYQMEFGEWPSGVSPRCEQIQAIFSQVGLTTTTVPNISERMWWKLAAYSGSSVLAVMRAPIERVWTAETKALVYKAVSETVAVAAAEGISLPSALPNEVVEILNRLPAGYKPSLLVDLERGNRLEMEAITGVVTRLGKKTDVPTPINDFIYACLKPYVNGIAEMM